MKRILYIVNCGLLILSISYTYTAVDGSLNTATFNALGDQGNLGGSIPGMWFITPDGMYGADQQCNTITLQNNKILIGGYTKTSDQFATLIRLNGDGTLDETFGTGGIVTFTDYGPGNPWVTCVVVQADNKIIVAGRFLISGEFRFTITRLEENGAVDTTFNAAGSDPYGGTIPGLWYISDQVEGQCSSIMIQPNGKIAAVGIIGSNQLIALRLDADGALDTTGFNAGSVNTPGVWSALDATPSQSVYFENGSSYTYGTRALTLQPDGKIVVVATLLNSFIARFGIIRFTNEGVIDETFNVSGDSIFGGTVPGFYVLLGASGDDFSSGYPYSIMCDNNARLIAAGYINYQTASIPFSIALTDAGVLDTTFNAGGESGGYGGPIPGFWMMPVNPDSIIQDGSSFISSVIDPCQRYLFTATTNSEVSPGTILQVITSCRLRQEGKLDTTFNPAPGAVGSLYGGTIPGLWYFPTSQTAPFDGPYNISSDIYATRNGQVLLGCAPSTGQPRFAAVSLTVSSGLLQDTNPPFSTGQQAQIYGGIIDQDENIVLCGNYNTIFTLVRYTADGERDNLFDGDGVAQYSLFGPSNAYSILQSADGSYYVTGEITVASTSTLAVLKYTNGGLLDTSFGNNGVALNTSAGQSRGLGIAQNTVDGSLLVAGQVTVDGQLVPAFVLFDASGNVAPQFGIQGVQTFSNYGPGSLYASLVSPSLLATGAGGISNLGSTATVATLVQVGQGSNTVAQINTGL